MKRLIFLALAFSGVAGSQTLTQSSSATTATRGTDISNMSFSPAIAWRLTFWYTGFTAVTMQLDCAPDNGSGVAGTYAACGGAEDGTTNPVTINATPQGGTIAVKTYSPHVAVNPSSVTATGTVHWVLTGLFGANTAPNTINATVTPSGTQNVDIVAPLGQTTMSASIPVVVASDQSAVKVQGGAAAGAAVAGNPNLIGGKDGSGNAQDFATDTQGNSYQFAGCPSKAVVPL